MAVLHRFLAAGVNTLVCHLGYFSLCTIPSLMFQNSPQIFVATETSTSSVFTLGFSVTSFKNTWGKLVKRSPYSILLIQDCHLSEGKMPCPLMKVEYAVRSCWSFSWHGAKYFLIISVVLKKTVKETSLKAGNPHQKRFIFFKKLKARPYKVKEM